MINSPNVIILAYNSYSCGKFVSNILSYNKNFIPQFPFNGNRESGYSQEYYDSLSVDQLQRIKHKTILLTIPKDTDLTNWTDYELGCWTFWGTNTFPYDANSVTPKALWALEQGLKCFIVAHNPWDLTFKRKSFPNATVIRIVNDYRVNALSRQLKMKSPVLPIDEFKNFQCNDCLEFDIDTLFNQEEFFKNITQLLHDLKLTNCSLDPSVFEYYQQYCDLYKNLLQ